MQIRIATSADAARVSDLIRSLSGPFFLSPDGAGAEPFLASINEDAISRYISSSNFSYFVAEDAGTLAGIVAIRDKKHLFHLFVAPAYQGVGVGRRLWEFVRCEAMARGNNGEFTVNSSLNAVAVYAKFGFVPTSEVVHVHGISFQPLAMSGSI
jgi:GNAT superfamily N-acetyltransferase